MRSRFSAPLAAPCLLALATAAFGCSSSDDAPGPGDGGADASLDAPSDATEAASLDAGSDASVVDAPREAAPETGADAPAEAATDAAALDAGPRCDAIALDATFDATLRVTADDWRVVYVNGALVEGQGPGWGSASTLTVQLFRNPTVRNVIAVLGINGYTQGGYDRGVVLDVSWPVGDAGQTASLVTDGAWRVQQADAVDAGLDWTAPGFDDSSWQLATDQGAQGMSPWGAVLGTSTARWLWFYDSSMAVSKPAAESAAFRRGFYVNEAGEISDVATGCR